jgi:chromosome partitioning protein
MIVVVGGIKGGDGKTTVATNLAVMRSQSGKKVLLVDTDEQGTTSKWVSQRLNDGVKTDWATIKLAGKYVGKELINQQAHYDDIIVDCGGRDTNSQRSALTVANKFLVPFIPRSFDIWSSEELHKMLCEILSGNSTLITYAFLNKADSRGANNIDCLKILSEIPEITCLKEIIVRRIAFANASSIGLGITELKIDKNTIPAIKEFKNIYDYVYQE